MTTIHQPLLLGGQAFPGIWRHLLPTEALATRFPEERLATCLSCPKVVTDAYRPDYRCCTYMPRIPNYMLGLALHDEMGAGAVRDLLRRGHVLPEGMERTPATWYAALQQAADDAFGRGDYVLCPLLDTEKGLCRAHNYRNGVCSTYFCLYGHGARGSRLWSAVHDYVTAMEAGLAQWALDAVGFDIAAYYLRFDELAARLPTLAGEGHGTWSRDALDHLWGEWRGRELELLRATAAQVEARKDDLRELAAAQPIRRPAAFERAETASTPPELLEEVEPHEIADEPLALLPPIPLDGYHVELMEALHALWEMPEDGTFLALGEGVTVHDDRVTFPSRDEEIEGDWALPLAPDEAAALKFFATPRAFGRSLMQKPPLSDLRDAPDSLAGWMGYGVVQALE